MSARTVWYSVSGGMISSFFSFVGPNIEQAARSAAKPTTTTIRPNWFARAEKPESVTKRPALLNAAYYHRLSGLDSKSIKTVTGLADGAEVRPDLETIRHVVERVVAERQILGVDDLI